MSHLCSGVRTWRKRQDKPTLHICPKAIQISASAHVAQQCDTLDHHQMGQQDVPAVVKIQCPYKYSDSLQGCTKDEQFCLNKSFALKHSHTYYYQSQLHMFVCDVKYCDFVLWSKKVFIVQRILRNEEFLQEALPKAQDFFISSVLPELLTRRHDPVLVSQRPCKHCERPDFGKMIICIKCSNHIHYTCAHIKKEASNMVMQGMSES